MSERVVAVVLTPPTDGQDGDLVAAMLEDVVDLVVDTPEVSGALLAPPGTAELARAAAWPDMPVVDVGVDGSVGELLAAAGGLAVSAAAVVVADVPDLPTLLLGKLFSALAGPPRLELAICPAGGGGLVAAAIGADAVPEWLVALDVRLDDFDALDRIRAAAPSGALAVGPGWHRIRSRADVAQLDPGLEGWDATRTLL